MELKIGVVTHYYSKIGVAIVEITDESLAIGDTIHIKGHTTDFQEPVTSMQIEHQQIQLAKKGDIIGLKVSQKCQEKDIVYKVIP
ncbi:MAG: translation elongation factor-like protein [candidate division WOR-3 bacterium]